MYNVTKHDGNTVTFIDQKLLSRMNSFNQKFITMLQNANFTCNITDPSIPSAICLKHNDPDNPNKNASPIQFTISNHHMHVNDCQRGKRCVTKFDPKYPVEMAVPNSLAVGLNYNKKISAVVLYDYHVHVTIKAYGKNANKSYIRFDD